ncbi:hypothetical protein GKE82_13660 [Conexibacter sp. W3-3-2]|uniref:hypothetical protein n=1 Tax=Conexibacter sp. W3-3-2 TaxID=2675227 RepID=UPI0012B890C8|nr:hypothetical protein [Conexibacter sp. W3-3-2]MTD45304.1 hypothetical protein [Conexibacter sp. W3-3-2]
MAKNPLQILTGLRIAVGVGAFVAPNTLGKLFGMDVDANPQASYMARLFGARDVALAVGTNATTGPSRATWIKIGVLTDAADVVSAVLGGRDGSLPKTTAVLGGLTAAGAVALGVAAANAGE